ncbi:MULTISPECIES: DUF6119 family protein [Cryobacterium]|uniref:DUF6119 family protein n=1 Tax=Cryobacterium TaxID=69578 RepID=UPI000CD46A6A|nr:MULTISPECIES: DUF6119 family protein [Cryobacterium]POH69955.1 hypothetical protein C3B60_02210 [Cryobacterium zongtaii]TFC42966.1 hypothetical protein E3O57_14670 [Cryobacterium sp. TMN-39-2]
MTSTRLTILLLKDVMKPGDAISPDKNLTEVALVPASGLNGAFYFTPSHPRPPAWMSFVQPVLDTSMTGLSSASASGLLVIKGASRFFAITFGYAKSYLDPSKIERQFGLRVALNRIDPAQIRSMDTKTFEDMVVTRNTQTSKSSDLPSFGVDVSRDILRAVTGEPRDKTLAKRLSGSDALVVTLATKVNDLPAKCDEFLAAYKDTAYLADFEWIDHLSLVNDIGTIGTLNAVLVDQLRVNDSSNTHMAMPEPIDWEDIAAFRIAGTRTTEYDDLDLPSYLSALGANAAALTIELLKSRSVSVRYARGGDPDGIWNIFQCLVSEQRVNGQLYVLIEGRWFNVSQSLVDKVDLFVNALPASTAGLTDGTPAETEPVYNARMASANPDKFLLLDAKIRRPGGAASGIEFCDLLSANGEILHVKRKSRSSTLSHLFAQGSVSASTFLSDPSYRDELRKEIVSSVPIASQGAWLDLVPDGTSAVDKSRYVVSYVVLAKSTKPGMEWLPFFSKLNLMQHGKQLASLGFKVSVTRLNN